MTKDTPNEMPKEINVYSWEDGRPMWVGVGVNRVGDTSDTRTDILEQHREMIQRLVDSAKLIMPLAKGYANQHRDIEINVRVCELMDEATKEAQEMMEQTLTEERGK